jgi:sugar-specific transcriptional regulator TrmB
MDEEALAALQRLGLTGYEARVYVALEKLQSATASEIADVSDVPRSQVYQTASALEDRGFIEKQQADPTRYRVVPVAEVREQFEAQFRADKRRAFEYLDSIQGSLAETEQESAAEIWTVRGRPNVAKRTRQLLDDAEETVVYGVQPEMLTRERDIADRLDALGDGGVDVTLLTGDDATVDLSDSVSVVRMPDERPEDAPTGRILAVDGTALLLSVVSPAGGDSVDDETAIWSADTDFAHVLIRLFEGWVGDRCS